MILFSHIFNFYIHQISKLRSIDTVDLRKGSNSEENSKVENFQGACPSVLERHCLIRHWKLPVQMKVIYLLFRLGISLDTNGL